MTHKPGAIIKANTHYYAIAPIACPGRHDVRTNPDERSEREEKCLLFAFRQHPQPPPPGVSKTRPLPC
jgi:hypothetical protein